MRKSSIILHWLIDYISFTRGTMQGYLHNTVPRHYTRSQATKKTPIILLPGLSLRWGFLKSLGDFLAIHGYPIYLVPALKSNFKSVAQSAEIVKAIIQENDLHNVIIIGHSKGGIIGKYLLLHHNQDDRITGIIALATPFNGTSLGKLIPHHSYAEFLPHGELMQLLQKNQKHNHKIISIAPSWDNHIWPQNGSFLEGAENIKLKGYGHHRILFSKELHETVLYAIEKLARKHV